MYLHPDNPIPRSAHLLWAVLDQIQLPYLKVFWVGGSHRNWRNAYYVPACVSYRPGIEHRLAIDFLGASGKWVEGNRKRSICCSEAGIEYMAIQRDLTMAAMMVQVKERLAKLRGEA